MDYLTEYMSPFGKILLATDGSNLVGLWFDEQKYRAAELNPEYVCSDDLPIFMRTKAWLNDYFKGLQPNAEEIPVVFRGSAFRQEVWQILKTIPYGEVISYGAIAAIIGTRHGNIKMSAQAVGGAVGHNPVSIIVPCHRVIGANGNLTGYAGGLERKIKLLKIERAYKTEFFVPKKGTAL